MYESQKEHPPGSEEGEDLMSEENKSVVGRWFAEVTNQGKLEVADELLAPEYVCHDPNSETSEVRAGALKESVRYFRNALADMRFEIEDMIAEGDKVVTRWTLRGTHRGELFGVKSSGEEVAMSGIVISHVAEGKIVEEWDEYDLLGLMRQLGAVTEPQQTAEA
jgi:steroid delta-isomerase-like uncharacterized protein